MFHDLEDHLLVVDRVQVVTNDGSSESFPSKRGHDKWIHVKGSTCHLSKSATALNHGGRATYRSVPAEDLLPAQSP
jgi:hypothetical protein